MNPTEKQRELMQIIDHVVETQAPHMSLILAPRKTGKTHALIFQAIAYAMRHAATVQTFACSSIFHHDFIAGEIAKHTEMLAKKHNSGDENTWFIFHNTSLITIELANDDLQNSACKVIYLDEFGYFDPVAIGHVRETMPDAHIIGVGTRVISSNPIQLDNILDEETYTVTKLWLSCQPCKDAGTEDACTHPVE